MSSKSKFTFAISSSDEFLVYISLPLSKLHSKPALLPQSGPLCSYGVSAAFKFLPVGPGPVPTACRSSLKNSKIRSFVEA